MSEPDDQASELPESRDLASERRLSGIAAANAASGVPVGGGGLSTTGGVAPTVLPLLSRVGNPLGIDGGPDLEHEELYWRENHLAQPFAGEGPYDLFAPAYRVGYEGYARHAGSRKGFEEAEPEIRAEFDRNGSDLPWDQALPAVRMAWERARLHDRHPDLGE